MGKFGLFVLGVLLGVASFAFAADGTTVNPLCSLIQALANNWGIITWLVVGILGMMVVGSGVMYLVQTKFAFTLAVVIGGTILLVATFRLMNAAGGEIQKFANSCQSVQIEIVKPVAKVE
jgi:hypothetical protein